jgi:mycothiol system anti-sigma-R factor
MGRRDRGAGMNCKEVKEAIFLFTDNEMDEALLTSFCAHLERCPECAEQIRYTRKLLTLVRSRCCREAAPARLRLRILQTTTWRTRRGSVPE